MKDRRELLAAGAGALPGLALGVVGEDGCERPARGPDARHFPNHAVVTHEGSKALFYDDLVAGRTVVLHCMSIATEPVYRTAESLARVQALLAGRLGRDVFFYSLTVDPESDTPKALREHAARHGAGPGWLFLTGETAVMHELRDRLFQGGGHVHDGQPGCSLALLRYGNAAVGLWGSVPVRADPEWIARRLSWVQAREPVSGPPRRRGPAPLRTTLGAVVLTLGLSLLAAAAFTPLPAQPPPAEPAPQSPQWNYPPCPYPESPKYPDLPGVCHPYQQPWPAKSTQTTTGCPGDCKTSVMTGEGIFPPSNPFNYKTFPGTNFLPTIYTNTFDSQGHEVLNTLPSTPDVPYNLQDGDPVVSMIDPTSPEDDLRAIFDQVLRLEAGDDDKTGLDPLQEKYADQAIKAALRRANDILEGNPVPGRAYSGFPLLHYTGPEKIKKVVPVYDPQGNVVGGNVDVHQVWYDQRIESDTAFIDATDPKIPANVPWTVTYTVDVLNRGEDDFSPYVMYVDVPTKSPGVGMDQSFFPMEDGTRTVFRIKMAPVPYLNLVYTWGWRMHPPRAQVMENATKIINYGSAVPPACPAEFQGKTLPQLEQAVFCLPEDPNCTSVRCRPGEPPAGCEKRKLYAISKIGEIAPEKRMWRAVEEARKAADRGDFKAAAAIVRNQALPAYRDWLERNELPAGVEKDPDSDVTLLYVNNTTYGVLTNGAWGRWDAWEERPKKLRVTVYNGDNFVHSYTIADFGGNRGWENQFKSSVKVAGSGCWFTFGRNYWWIPVGGPLNPYVCVPPANGPALGRHKLEMELNYDPSRRLRFYQFDPFHHDVAIYSVH